MDTQTGIVNCAVYRQGRKLDELTVDAISDVLKEEGTFVWVGLFEPDEILMRKIQEEFGLHELAVEDAQNAHQRPKLEEYGETVFVVLHTALLSDNDIQFGETHVFVGRRFVITVRHGPSLGYTSVRERTESRPELLATGPGYVLYSLILSWITTNRVSTTCRIGFGHSSRRCSVPNPSRTTCKISMT